MRLILYAELSIKFFGKVAGMSQEVRPSVVERVHEVAGALLIRSNFVGGAEVGIVRAPAYRQRLFLTEEAIVDDSNGRGGSRHFCKLDILVGKGHYFFRRLRQSILILLLSFIISLSRLTSKPTQLIVHFFPQTRIESLFWFVFQQRCHGFLAPAARRLCLFGILRGEDR